jgi:hypothetical protein
MSLVIYRGPSVFDPSRGIRGVLTADSANAKTGNMAQLYILDDQIAPHLAQRTGDDQSVCGDCPLRPHNSGGCYVVTFQGPLSTWRATAGLPVAGAAVIAAAVRKAGSIRLGAYGDPAALPSYITAHLIKLAAGRVTGYTHGHLRIGMAGVAHLRSACMMSCETPDQARVAHAAGWRTFRVTAAGAGNLPNEITCPSETRGATCRDCLLCRGDSIGARSITIPAHGFTKRRALQVVQ